MAWPKLAVLLATALVSLAWPRAAPASAVLRLGVATTPVPATPNSVLWLASDLGFYAREGLEVQLTEFTSTSIVMTGLLAGSLDIGNVSTEAVLHARAEGQSDLRAIHSPDPDQHFLLIARAELTTPGDLRGRTFAVSTWEGVDASLSRLVLQSLGVDPREVHFVALGEPSTRATALRAGKVGATTVSLGTWASLASDPRLRVLVDAPAFLAAAPLVSKVDAVSSRTLQERPDAVRGFTTALLKASRYFAADQPAWVEAMLRRRPDLDPDTLAWLWQQYQGAWPVNGCMLASDYQAAADVLYASPAFHDVPSLPLDAWTAPQVVASVLDDLGRQPGRC